MKWKVFKAMADTAVRMMLRVPYMMVLYYSMTIYETEEIPTLAVNGVSMWVNPNFWNQLSREQKLTATVHEVFHKMCMHSSRRGARDMFIYNEAGDHYINNRLVAMKFVPLENMIINGKPWSWLCDVKYAGPEWTTESIYDDIVKEREKKHAAKKAQEEGDEATQPSPEEEESDSGDAGDSGHPDIDGEGDGSDDSATDGKGTAGKDPGDVGSEHGNAPRRIGSEESERRLGPLADIRDFGTGPNGEEDNTEGTESVEKFEDRVRKEIKAAEAMAKQKGNVPGWLERIVGKAFHAKANWYDTLYEHLKSMSRADYSWRRWNKREFVKTGCISPDMYQPNMGGILKFIDTSGSVSAVELALYDKHMMDVLEQVKPKWIVLAYWDTKLHRLDKFERHEYDMDTSMLRPVGGGGTDFTGWQQVIDDLDEQPDVVLAYTDMCATFPEELSVPTVWLSTASAEEAPFGTLININ